MSNAISQLVYSSSAVESGFIAAGVTISVIVALQTIFIVVSWLVSAF